MKKEKRPGQIKKSRKSRSAERKDSSDPLKDERNLLRTLIDILPFWIYIKDPRSRFVLGNQTLANKYLKSSDPNRAVGKTDFDLVPREKAKRLYDEEQKLLETGEPIVRRLDSYVDEQGEEVYLEITKVPLRDKKGKIIGIVGINNDITERRRNDEALLKSRQMLEEERNLLRTLIDNLPVAVYVKDTQCRFVIANVFVASVMKTSASDLIGKTDFDYYPKDQAAVFHAEERRILETGRPLVNKNEPVVDGTGNTRWILTTKLPLRDREGTIIGIVGIGIDDSERKREEDRRHLLEEQLRQAEKMKAIGHLAGGVAHDFNNQLVAIMGSADMIKTWPDDRGVAQHAEMILAASKRAADLTGKLLAFARKGRYQSVTVDVHQLIDEVVSLLERSIDKRIRIVRDFRADIAWVKGDPTQLQNAFLNIGINARDAMTHEGNIIFSTEVVVFDDDACRNHPHEIRPGRYIQIGITDTGVGMNDETKKHIFEPFFTTKKEGEGTGMGLAAVYGAVRNHQGTVSFSSELGHGTRFKICLPLMMGDGEREAGGATGKPVSGVAHILVVDDEEVVRVTITAILQRLGYRVTVCSDGEEAAEYYRNSWREVDLVIIDMIMPRMGGLETFLAMKECNPNVKAILSSGYSLAGEAQRAMEEGAMAFIQKPFQMAALSHAVADALGKE